MARYRRNYARSEYNSVKRDWNWRFLGEATVGVFLGLVGGSVLNKVFEDNATLGNPISDNCYDITWTDAAMIGIWAVLFGVLRGRMWKTIFGVALATSVAALIVKVIDNWDACNTDLEEPNGLSGFRNPMTHYPNQAYMQQQAFNNQQAAAFLRGY